MLSCVIMGGKLSDTTSSLCLNQPMHSMMRPASYFEINYKSFKNEIAVVAAFRCVPFKGTLTFVLLTHC